MKPDSEAPEGLELPAQDPTTQPHQPQHTEGAGSESALASDAAPQPAAAPSHLAPLSALPGSDGAAADEAASVLPAVEGVLAAGEPLLPGATANPRSAGTAAPWWNRLLAWRTSAAPSATTARAVRQEVRDFVLTHEQRRRQFPRAALVGLIAGLIGTLFRLCLTFAEDLRASQIHALHAYGPVGILLPIFVGISGSVAAVGLVSLFAPEASGSGIPHLKAVLLHLRTMNWERILPVKFLGGVSGIAAGLALGREGPTIQMGGAVGQMVGELLHLSPRERQTLIAAGAGAGLAAAFNAPLAGMVFVLEEVQRDFTPTVFGAALVASVVADVVTRLITGQNPVFHMRDFPNPPLTLLPAFILVGFLAGALGVAFNRALLGSLNLFRRIPGGPVAAGAVAGLVVGAVAWFNPDVVGGGYPILSRTFVGAVPVLAVIGFFCLRFGLTMISYGCGAPGGIFAPLLVTGALLGLLVGQATHALLPGIPFYPAAFAVIGMGAYFSAIVRAPLTGIVLMLEMTGIYSGILPLLLACLTAYATADALGDRPVYEALLERDLVRGEDLPEVHETVLVEHTLQPHAPFEGKAVRALGLPAGCILVTVHRGVTEFVPTASTILQAGDRITAVIAPEALPAASMLRRGMEAG